MKDDNGTAELKMDLAQEGAADSSAEAESLMVTADGMYDDVIQTIADSACGGDKALAAAVFMLLHDNDELLDDNEQITGIDFEEKWKDGQSGLLSPGGAYYFNVSKAKICGLFILLSAATLVLAGPTAAGIVEMYLVEHYASELAKSGKAAFRPDEWSGQKCILLQMSKIKREYVKPEDIRNFIGRKCEGYYDCRFNAKGRCTCKKKDIKSLLKGLSDLGAVEKVEGVGYRYVV